MILDERSHLIKPEHVKDNLETYKREGMALRSAISAIWSAGHHRGWHGR